MSPAPLLLDLRATAAALGFSYSAVRHWTYQTKKPPAGWPATVKIGNKSIRYRHTDLQTFVEQLGSAGEAAISSPPPEPGARRRGRPRKSAKGGC